MFKDTYTCRLYCIVTVTGWVLSLPASELYGSLETPSVESLVSWLLEHPHIPQEDSDSDSNSYDIHSDTDSMSDDVGDLDSFEVRLCVCVCVCAVSYTHLTLPTTILV